MTLIVKIWEKFWKHYLPSLSVIAVDSVLPFRLMSRSPLLALENVLYKTIKSQIIKEMTDGALSTWNAVSFEPGARVVVLPVLPCIMSSMFGLQALSLLFDIADHVKYITYIETNDDCKIPLVGLNSCTFGKRLITVAIKQSIKLNVMKNTWRPHPLAYI